MYLVFFWFPHTHFIHVNHWEILTYNFFSLPFHIHKYFCTVEMQSTWDSSSFVHQKTMMWQKKSITITILRKKETHENCSWHLQSNLLQAKQQCLPTFYFNFACIPAPAWILSINTKCFLWNLCFPFAFSVLSNPDHSVPKNTSMLLMRLYQNICATSRFYSYQYLWKVCCLWIH